MAYDESVLRELYRRIDSEHPEDALELLSPVCVWEFSLPDRTVMGGRAEFAEFVRSRPRTPAHHDLTVVASTGAQEVIAGWLDRGDGDRALFVATALCDREGLITALLLRRTGLELTP